GQIVKEGSLITNGSTHDLVAIHIRNLNGTFTVPANAHGGVFTEVWLKNDKTEAIFNGARIQTTKKLWMKVSPKGPNPDSTLRGSFSDRRIDPPNPSEWSRVFPVGDGPVSAFTKNWAQFIEAVPQHHRAIRLYGVSNDGNAFLALTDDGDLVWYGSSRT